MSEEQAGKRVLMILPSGRFEDNCYIKVRQILERYGHSVKVASVKRQDTFGLNKTRAKPDHALSEIDFSDFDVIYLVGGIGAAEYYDHKELHSALQKAYEHGKILAAIGNSPLILAKAGLLKGRKATLTYFESKRLEELGGEYTGKTITFDENIMTAKGSEVSDKFGLALMKILAGQPMPYVP